MAEERGSGAEPPQPSGTVEAPGFAVGLEAAPDRAEGRLRELLAEEGFGVLTEIDVSRTLGEKLGLDFRPYRILGACNPGLAHAALEADPGVGLLLPCNIVVEAHGPGTLVRFLDPQALMGGVPGPVGASAAEASRRLRRVAGRLEALGA